MTCEEFQVRLTAYSLGELEPGERQAAREHVAACGGCASGALLDRQLTALLRTSAVPAPAETKDAVRAALRAEADRLSAPPRRPARRRHWIALAAATLAAAAVIAAALLLVPAPDPGSPLAAAWSSYHAQGHDGLGVPSEQTAQRLFAVLGPASRTPDLAGYGLKAKGWAARDLAGHLAAVAEYRDGAGGRVTLMRWRGELPRVARAPAGSGLKAYRWGRHTSYWWRSDSIVWCLVGTVDQDELYRIAEHLGGES
jgi:putative zinc finger protein